MIVGIISVLIFLETTYAVKVSCRDEKNKPVDWFVLYKLPLIKEDKDKLVKNGEGYAYMTSEDDRGWTISKKSMDDEDSVPGNTLAPIYEGKTKKDLLYILYNDQEPGDRTDSGGGHAKGAVVAGESGGFWLVHSVPRFPKSPSKSKKYSYAENGLINGQSFLCITLKPKDLEIVGDQLKYNDVNIYADAIPKDLKAKYRNLVDVADGEKIKSAPWYKVRKIDSAAGQTFRVFSKSVKWDKELYSDLVAPDLNTNLVVQTWPNGRTHQGSTCGKRKPTVENIDETDVAGVTFKSSKDHSKWAASKTKSKPWVCIGDINKDDSQEKRGGGTVCTSDPVLWKAYHDAAAKLENCRRSKSTQGDNSEEFAPVWKPEFWEHVMRISPYYGMSDAFGDVGTFG